MTHIIRIRNKCDLFVAFSCLLLLIKVIAKTAISQKDSFHLKDLTFPQMIVEFKSSWNCKTHFWDLPDTWACKHGRELKSIHRTYMRVVSFIWFFMVYVLVFSFINTFLRIYAICPKAILVLVAVLLCSESSLKFLHDFMSLYLCYKLIRLICLVACVNHICE